MHNGFFSSAKNKRRGFKPRLLFFELGMAELSVYEYDFQSMKKAFRNMNKTRKGASYDAPFNKTNPNLKTITMKN